MELIGTLPTLWDRENIKQMMQSEEISSVRFNSGVSNLMNARQIVYELKKLEEKYNKKIYIDLKGRQLRIISWADPRYEVVELNHDIEVEYPAFISFRGCSSSEIAHVRGNKIALTRPPKMAVGKGQSVNVLAKSLNIKGYLTDNDVELINASKEIGMNNYMASFVEGFEDIYSIKQINPQANVISKIESPKGVNFALNSCIYIPLMIGRDDLFTEYKGSVEVLKVLKELIKRDASAICASKVFSSLEKDNEINLCDYEDIELMKMYGYKRFMLADDIKGPKLTKALNAWRSING